MIKFLAERDGRPMLGFGLSRGNCEKLLEGKPIFVDLKLMLEGLLNGTKPINDTTVLIFGGETEASMTAEIEAYLGPIKDKMVHNEEN
jgi:hypothetical protein